MNDLVDFELDLLRAMCGLHPAFQWGAAVGAALEVLQGRGLVRCTNGRYEPTAEGERLARENH